MISLQTDSRRERKTKRSIGRANRSFALVGSLAHEKNTPKVENDPEKYLTSISFWDAIRRVWVGLITEQDILHCLAFCVENYGMISEKNWLSGCRMHCLEER